MVNTTPQVSSGKSRPEIDLLLSCASCHLDSARTERIKALTRGEIDWPSVLRAALAHRVMPLLYKSLNTARPDNVPQAVSKQLQSHYYANAAHNLLLAGELLKILRLFEGHNVPAIPYKGPVLAASIYGNVACREFADLDILVRERDYDRAQHLLISQDFRLVKKFDWESTFVDTRGRVAVDLHRGMAAREFPCPLAFEYLAGRLQPVDLVGTTAATLCPEDNLLMLAIQISKDSGSRYLQLAKVCDIAELVRVYPHLDWAQVLRQARRLGGERMLLYSLRLANNLLGTVLSQEVVCAIGLHPAIDGLVEYARRQLFDQGDRTVVDQPTVDQFRWLVRERLRDKLYPYYLRYVMDVIVPCELDRRLLRLPGRLSFLYFLMRPARLVGKYGLLLAKSKKHSVG